MTALRSVPYDQLHEHGPYVADAVKVSGCRRALNNIVRQGNVVIDLGCGTGLLDPLVVFDPPGGVAPPLNRSGQCRRAVLEAMANGRPFADIVELIDTDYDEQFGTGDDVRRYVRDMVALFCERT
jgi:hypothetical protein